MPASTDLSVDVKESYTEIHKEALNKDSKDMGIIFVNTD